MRADGVVAGLEAEGYAVVPDVLDDADLAPVAAEYANALDWAGRRLCELGQVTSDHAHLSFAERYIKLLSENPAIFYYLGVSLPLDYETLDPEYVRVHAGPALFALLSHPKILDVVERVLGQEISSNPVQQVRLKPPQRLLTGATAEYSNVGLTAWHQDYGAVMAEAKDTEILTVWVAMTDAPVEMGCLTAIPGSHRERELTLHCPGKLNTAENYIPQALIERRDAEPVPLPVTKGSLVLLTRFTEHAALPNVSDRLRWSFDLRYQRTGEPTGRPAFPSFVLRSRSDPESEATADVYASGWEATREQILSGAIDGPLYEQGRWLANADDPVCA